MRNKYLYIILLLITGCSSDVDSEHDSQSKEASVIKRENVAIDSYDLFVKDSLKSNDSLKVYEYQNLTAWGGLTLKYLNDKLQTIETSQNPELGFTKKIFSIDDDKIIKADYIGHHAEWSKYEEKYPKEDHEWDPSKMTYFDTSFTVDYNSDTYKKSHLSEKIKREGEQVIKFIIEENINAANSK